MTTTWIYQAALACLIWCFVAPFIAYYLTKDR